MGDAVTFPGYERLEGPEALPMPGGGRVESIDDYRAWQRAVVEARHGQVWDSPAPPAAVAVNWGRWVAICRWCGQGVFTRPDWRVAYCGECGARYEEVEFPADAEQIEQALCRRPSRQTQNWLPTETVDDLITENAAHGVGV